MTPLEADWVPTAHNINALPDPVRRFIHDLETRVDPAGDTRELAIARDTIRQLAAQCVQGWLGHKQVTTTRKHYAPVLVSRLKQASERLAGRFGKWESQLPELGRTAEPSLPPASGVH